MKNLLLFLILISTINTSCSQKVLSTNNVIHHSGIIDSLKYVTILPNDNFYPTGDSICTKIIKNHKKLTPDLINKINDTTSTNCEYAASYFLKVGDIALELLAWSYKKNELPLREILNSEFDLKNPDDFSNSIYYDLFHSNSPNTNLSNRLKLKNALIKWKLKKI